MQRPRDPASRYASDGYHGRAQPGHGRDDAVGQVAGHPQLVQGGAKVAGGPRATADPDQRAALVARAEELTMQQLPFIPDVEPDTVLVLGKGLTGALSSTAYLFSPWADQAGGTG